VKRSRPKRIDDPEAFGIEPERFASGDGGMLRAIVIVFRGQESKQLGQRDISTVLHGFEPLGRAAEGCLPMFLILAYKQEIGPPSSGSASSPRAERHREPLDQSRLCFLTRTTSSPLTGKGNIVVDFLHVIAIVEHAQQPLEQAQFVPVENLDGLRKKGDFLDFQLKSGECLE